jgi:tRNA modification GTPase
MEFVHQPYQPGETIAAIATPPGEGGVAIIRISGDRACDVAAAVFTGPVHSYESHEMHFGSIVNAHGEHIDEVLLVVMKGRRSYTGEDTVEIHCHGGGLITRRVLDVVIAAGARAARPGEFTFKAFINGKIDLAQAEAVQALIGAKNEHAVDAAGSQLRGNLSAKISAFQESLTSIAAILEAWVDFPEEGLEFATIDEVIDQLESVCQMMERLAATFRDGRILQEGVTLCLVGSPNVGKSSLMNALLDKDRAIVSHIPGTTRDILEDHFRINGLNFRLLDTAGIRETAETVEQEGIRRTKEAMAEADLILLVLDASKEMSEEERRLVDSVPQAKSIAVWNKIDLCASFQMPETFSFSHQMMLSAKTKIGLELLHDKIDKVIWDRGPPSREEIWITNVRHKEALVLSIEACRRLIEGLRAGVSPEFLSMEMRQCLMELGKIIGTNITEGILSAIFSSFCIGK